MLTQIRMQGTLTHAACSPFALPYHRRMPTPYTREKIENWVGDYCVGDSVRRFSAAMQEHAAAVLAAFLSAACTVRGVEPDEIEESDIKAALLEHVARLKLPEAVREEVPALCGSFLAELESQGRLGGGRILGAYVAALKDNFVRIAAGKGETYTRPGSKLGRNDPCPCGSGRKYKACCME